MITHGQLAAMTPEQQRLFWRSLRESLTVSVDGALDRDYQADAREARRNHDWSRE